MLLANSISLNRRSLFFIFLTVIFSHSGIASSRDSIFKLPVKKNEIKIASYNVLNLFDARHDPGKRDFTFLNSKYPGKRAKCMTLSSSYYREQCLTTNWSIKKYKLKLKQIKKAMNAQGTLPDILAVQEIENYFTAKGLAMELGFDGFLITNSPDNRGIDVALFYRTQKVDLLEWEEIELPDPEFKDKPTRNLLRAHFEIKSSKSRSVLGVYANHWPSQAVGPEKRVLAAKAVRREINRQVKRLGKNNYFYIALGDFNTTTEERPNPITTVLSERKWSYKMVDAQNQSLKYGNNPAKGKMAPNSYWYRSTKLWNKFDRILMSQNFIDGRGIEFVKSSFRIVSPTFMRARPEDKKSGSKRVPFSYNFQTSKVSELGYSDHFPVVAKFRIY